MHCVVRMRCSVGSQISAGTGGAFSTGCEDCSACVFANRWQAGSLQEQLPLCRWPGAGTAQFTLAAASKCSARLLMCQSRSWLLGTGVVGSMAESDAPGAETFWLFFLTHEAGRAAGWEADLVSCSSAAFFTQLLNFSRVLLFPSAGEKDNIVQCLGIASWSIKLFWNPQIRSELAT